MELLLGLFFQISLKMPGSGSSYILSLLFTFVIFFSAIYLLVVYKKAIVRLLAGKEKDESPLPIDFSGRQLLHVTIVVLCLVTLIGEIPVAVSILIETLKTNPAYSDTENDFYDPIMSASFLSPIIKTLFAVLVLLLSKKISNFLNSKMDKPESLIKG